MQEKKQINVEIGARIKEEREKAGLNPRTILRADWPGHKKRVCF